MLKLFLVLIAVAYALIFLQSIPGSVQVEIAGQIHQFSFFISALLLLLSFMLLLVALVIVNFILDLPKTVMHIFRQRQINQSHNDLQKSFSQLMIGNFESAEQIALKRLPYSKTPTLNLLLACFSAYKRDKLDLANQYLTRSNYLIDHQDEKNAIDSFNVQLKIQSGFVDQASKILESLCERMPKNVYLLDNLIKIYIHEKNFSKAYQLLPKIKDNKAYPDQKYFRLETYITQSLLKTMMYSENLIRYGEFWNILTRQQKSALLVKLQYLAGLDHLNSLGNRIQLFKRLVLDNADCDDLWKFLAKNPKLAQNLDLEKLVKLTENKDKPWVSIVIAKSYFDQGQVEKAIEIANNCVYKWQKKPIWLLLAQIYESMGDKEKTLNCYKQLEKIKNKKSVEQSDLDNDKDLAWLKVPNKSSIQIAKIVD